LPIFSIRNLALTDSHVKINSYYKDAISESIILNPYLAALSTWFEHMDISRVLGELVELISRRFPYVQAKQNSLELHTVHTPTKVAEISPLNFP